MAACEGGDTETAFVLQHRPWGERDLSVELYAARRGRLVARLYGGQNAHSKRRAALVAFAELQVTLARGARPWPAVREVGVLEHWPGLWRHWRVLQCAGNILRLLRRCTPLEDGCLPVYDDTRAVLAAMAVEGADLAWLHFLFLLRLCAHGGWAPDLQHCSTCGRQASPTQAACFDPQEGGLRCRVCGGRGVPLPGALRVQLQCCATGPFCPQPPAGAETWLRFATPLDAFVQHHCPVAP